MKKTGRSPSGPTLVFPGATGWRIRLPGGQTTSVQALEEAAATIPAGASVHLALPCNAAVFERMTLPSVDREELSGMVQLQLEKTLPYPVEEVSAGFDVISQAENESTLVSVTAHHFHLDQLCEAFRKSFVPEKVTVYAQHVAASCAANETVLCLWTEDGKLVVSVCEDGKLGYAQVVPETDPTAVMSELPGVLLRAEMEGVPSNFDRVRIEQGCGGLRDQLADLLGKPVEVFSFDTPLPEPPINLVPSTWIEQTRRLEQSGKLKNQLQMAAMVYLFLVAGAFLYLAFLKSRVQKLDVQIQQTLPLQEFQIGVQDRWNALAPAVQPERYPVEILSALFASRPGADVKFTRFDAKPDGFRLDYEAPNAGRAIEFADSAAKNPAITTFKVDAPTPKIVGEVSQGAINGKL